MTQMLDRSINRVVAVLSADDFAGYEYNKPKSGDWELVELPDGLRVWTPKQYLMAIPVEVE